VVHSLFNGLTLWRLVFFFRALCLGADILTGEFCVRFYAIQDAIESFTAAGAAESSALGGGGGGREQ
jgi:hypothetical protein